MNYKKFYQLLFNNSINKFVLYTGIALLVGIIHSAIILIINQSINLIYTGKGDQMIGVFFGMLAGYVVLSRILGGLLIRYTQKLLVEFRLRVLRQLMKSSYTQVRKQSDEVYNVLTTDIANLSGSFLHLINFLVSIVTVMGCFAYMFVLSWKITVLTIMIACIGVLAYRLNTKRNIKQFQIARDTEEWFIRGLKHLLYGFKEIKLAPAKGEEIYHHEIKKAMDLARESFTKGAIGFLNNSIFGQIIFYIFIGALLLMSGRKEFALPEVLVSMIVLMSFILGPIGNIMALIPELFTAAISAGKIQDLLDEYGEETLTEETQKQPTFESIQLENVQFSYDEFKIGPIDFRLDKGDLVFIYGGNGSGKTTFINLLTGLLPISKGNLILNNAEEITSENLLHYQSLFSSVFSDFYLFDKLYGVDDIDEDEISDYLTLFEMKDKVTYRERTFSSTQLSTGQRKRLAFIIQLIEKRPILILDEWAADQDPYFRKKFYTEILPFLKLKGITVLALTHDDQYYSVADKLFHMDYGRLTEKKIIRKEMDTLNF